MNWTPWKREPDPSELEKQYRRGYTDGQLADDYATATGTADNLDANAVGMVAFGIAMYTGAFAVAEITPAMPALDPDHMASIARRLLTGGDALDAITVNADGLALLPREYVGHLRPARSGALALHPGRGPGPSQG